MGREPGIGEQLRQLPGRLARQPLQHIFEIGEGVAPSRFAPATKLDRIAVVRPPRSLPTNI
jgi:hypothetical protein